MYTIRLHCRNSSKHMSMNIIYSSIHFMRKKKKQSKNIKMIIRNRVYTT